MATRTPRIPTFDTVADLVERLDDIPLSRIRLRPVPGTATEQDVIHAESRFGRLCELVDGILVEKAVGHYESRVGGVVFHRIESFLEDHDLGIAYPADGMTRLLDGLIRLPDVSFYSWRHFPDRLLPVGQVLNVAPDLPVEVLSPSNTRKEMARKRKEYFLGGCKLVWEINPIKKTVRVYTAPDVSIVVREKGTLDGGNVLPGFKLSVAALFARAGKRAG